METKNYSFKDLLSVIIDNRGKTCPTSDKGLPLIATNCIKMDSLYPVFEKVRYVSEETYENWFRGHPEPNDIIFVCKGSPGRVALAPNPVNFCIAQDMLSIRANEGIIDQKFLFALLRSNQTQKKILNMHVGTLIPHFKKGDFGNLYFDIPTNKSLQKSIGDVYYKLSSKIELNRKMNNTLEEMAHALFKSWFVDFDPVIDNALAVGNEIPEALQAKTEKRKSVTNSNNNKGLPKNIQSLFPNSFIFNDTLDKWIPEGWEVMGLEDLVEHQKGFAFKSKWYQDKGHIIVRVSDTTDDSIKINTCNRISKELAKQYESYALNENDVVIATVGSWPPNYSSVVGKVIKVPKTANGGLLNQNAVRLRVNKNYNVHQGFLHLNLKNPRFMDYIINRAQGSANQASITLKSIFKFPILMSKQGVLDEFSTIVKLSFDKQNKNLEQNQSLIKLRDTLLPQLISGKLKVPEAMLLVEEVIE